MFYKLFGSALIGIGVSMVGEFKKKNGSFNFKSRKGKVIVAIFIVGVISIFIPSGTVKSDDYVSIASPDNAPWENHLTKKEAKSIGKQTKEDISDFKKSIDLDKSEKKRFFNGAYNIGKAHLITQELVFIGSYLSENTFEENNVSKKDAKIMLDYVKKIEKPLVESSEFLNDYFEGFHFSDYVYSVEIARDTLEEALEITYKNGSSEEIDDVITNGFFEYIERPSKYFTDGSIWNEFSEYYSQ